MASVKREVGRWVSGFRGPGARLEVSDFELRISDFCSRWMGVSGNQCQSRKTGFAKPIIAHAFVAGVSKAEVLFLAGLLQLVLSA